MSVTTLLPFRRLLDKFLGRSRLSEEEQQAILSLPGHAAQVRCNHDFVRLGERVDHSSLVVEGLIGRFGQNRDGNRQITAVHIAGDMVDLHSVVAPEASSALQALAVSTIIKIPHAALRDVAQRYPAVARLFWRECVVDAAVLAEWLVNIGRRDARRRVAHLLCEMACRYDKVDGNETVRFSFPVTQMHLADMMALTPVHVNRTLMSLRMEELIDMHRHEVTIHHWSKLARLGEFDPGYLRAGLRNQVLEPADA